MEKKGNQTVINSYVIALDALRLAVGHLITIQNQIGDFRFSKPVNIGHKDLDDIYWKLRNNLEDWQGKSLIELDTEFSVIVRPLNQGGQYEKISS